MKHIITASALIMLVSSCDFNTDDKSIRIDKTTNSYRFEASYPQDKTERIVNYIEKTLKEKRLFSAVGMEKKAEINLGDSILFDLTAKPGFIEIKFLKNRNSEASFHKLENLCAGIKDELQR